MTDPRALGVAHYFVGNPAVTRGKDRCAVCWEPRDAPVHSQDRIDAWEDFTRPDPHAPVPA